MAEERTRGSSQLLENVLGEKGHIDPSEVRRLVDLLQGKGGKILDWCQYGQPGIDGVCGRVEFAPREVGALFPELLGLQHIRPRLEVFPLGIPVIDRLLVDIRVGRVSRH